MARPRNQLVLFSVLSEHGTDDGKAGAKTGPCKRAFLSEMDQTLGMSIKNLKVPPKIAIDSVKKGSLE